MRFISFAKNGSSGAGFLKEEGILPVTDLGYKDAYAFMAAGEPAVIAAERLIEKVSSRDLLPLKSVRLLAPVPAAIKDSLHRPQLSRSCG